MNLASCGSRSIHVAVAVLAMLSCIGCDKVGPSRYAVSGSVTLDGAPVENATIIFTPIGDGLAAAAVIADGKFDVTAENGPTAGEFHVRINPSDGELEAVEADPSVLAVANRRPRIPKIYQSNGTLTASIKGEPDQFLSFELKSE